jgi:hypothetical protein
MSRPKIKDWVKVTLALSVDVRKSLQELAEQEHVSMSQVIDDLVRAESDRLNRLRQQPSTRIRPM